MTKPKFTYQDFLNAFKRWRDIPGDQWRFLEDKQKAWDYYCSIRDSIYLEPAKPLKTYQKYVEGVPIKPVTSTVSEIFEDEGDGFSSNTVREDVH